MVVSISPNEDKSKEKSDQERIEEPGGWLLDNK